MVDSSTNNTSIKKYRFLSGGGEMGALTREKDWSQTPVGHPETWPQSLRTTLGIILNSKFPMFLWWGPQLICFYNDAYRPSLGENGKHPDILGIPAAEAWPEIWDIIKPLINQVLDGGEATWAEDQLIPIFRNGKIEDVYWTFSYSPVNDESGNVAGVLVTCTETTDKILTYKKLEESKNQLQFAIDAAEMATWDIDPFTNTFTGDDRLKEWHGLAPEAQFDLENGFAVVIEKDKEELRKAIARSLEFSSGGMLDVEYTIVNPHTKQTRHVRAKGRASFGEDKIAYRLNGTLQDVTGQVQARKKLEESEQDLLDMVTHSPIGICVLDATTLVAEIANTSFIEVAGKSYEEIVSKFYWDSFAEARPYYETALNDVVKKGITYYADEVELMLIRHGKEEIVYVTFVYAPLKNVDGEVKKVAIWVMENTPQVMARQKIEEADKRFRNTVRQAPVGITILRGPEFFVEVANDAYLELVDRKEESFVGRPIFESLPEVKDTVQGLLEGVLYTGIPFHGIEYAIPINRFGKHEISYFNFLYHPLKEANGDISGIIVTVTDVTESVKAKHLLAESENQFRNMVMQSPIPMTIIRGKDFIIETANKVMFDDIWRKKEAEVVGRGILEVFPELLEQKYEQLLNDVFITGKVHREKESIAYVQGDDEMKKFYLDFEYAPLFEKDNTVSGIIITVNDVTEKVEARIIIEESEKEFRQLADSLPELVWTTDSKGEQTFASKRWSEFTGLDPYDADTFEQMVHPEDLQGIIKTWTHCLATGEKYEAQVRLKSKEGDYQWFYVKGEPLRDEDGNIEKWVGAFTNFNDQKKAEEELVAAFMQIEESEIRFRNVANSAPVFIWMADTDKMRNFFNTAWLKFTGRTLEQEKGNGWAEGIHPEDFKRCISFYIESFDKREEFYFEYRLKRYDGEYRWVSAKAVPRFTVDGIFEGYIGACMDIHERVIYQKKLKEDEERLNIIINASELGTWELYLKEKKLSYSDRYLEILGYESRVDLTHEQLLQHIHPADLTIRNEALEEAFVTGILHYESRLIWNDKSIHWIEGKGKVFYDENNEPTHLIGTVRDITDEKNHQQELIDREKKFRLLADSMPEFVWTGDEKGNLNYFNQSVYDYSGFTAKDIEEGGWMQIVHPEEREENTRLWMHSIATGTDFIFEHRFRRHDGEYRWQLSRATPQRDDEGRIQMWVGTSTDIQQIKEQDQQKDLFISMASHELKTPITSIKGYVQILQSMYEGTEDKFLINSLNTVDKQIVTLTKLIAELLDLSKIKSGNLILNLEHFAIDDLVSDIIGEIKHINPTYTITFAYRANTTVYADRDRIGQVLINFLTNAVKYSPDSRKIKVNSIVKDNAVVVSVEDTGIGINKPDQEKIFQRFYRVEGKNEKTFPGFGIGLFIASEIINRHNGKIGVDSMPGKGSVFYFSLPIKKD